MTPPVLNLSIMMLAPVDLEAAAIDVKDSAGTIGAGLIHDHQVARG